MKLISTGRILERFCRDLRMLAKYPGVTLRALPISLDPYRPPGVWAFCEPGPGRPLLFRFPPPLHPLEAIAAIRGLGGLEPEDFVSPLETLKDVYQQRGSDWLTLTERIAEKLFVSEQTVRLLYHLLTPLNTNLVSIREALWDAAGVWPSEWNLECAHIYSWPGTRQLAPRPHFWAAETAGDIEL